MITVFAGTNRKDSRTLIFAEHCYKLLQDYSTEPVQFFSLADLPEDLIHTDMYGSDTQSPELVKIQDKYLIPATKLYFVSPEYNGSYPGILKFFLDACSVRAYKESFHGGKKAALLGIASGRAGNLRGMDHLADVLNYLNIAVMPNKQPISSINSVMDEHGQLSDVATKEVLVKHVRSFIEF